MIAFLSIVSRVWKVSAQSRPTTLTVDIDSPEGTIRHGAMGWLYGLAAPGIPRKPIIATLNPGIAAQKAPGGLQHPAGDALLVAHEYRAAGGKEIQIYLQDIYPHWPYDNRGMDDYLSKIKAVVREVDRSGDPGFFVYVPFNEPDNNWYGYSGEPLHRFLSDWERVFLAIRSMNSSARIAGPNFEHFKPETYRQFLTFARDHDVLPNEMTWHELHDDFFTSWYARYATYRQIERHLGIAPLPIVIDEYAREKGDLAVPGNLVQWITRFENSGVDACLAFWTPSGTLSDLVARTWANRPTGAWWLYRWYGQMSGRRLKVESPAANAIGIQGLASYEERKKQVRILFGGQSGDIEVRLRGLAHIFQTSSRIHIALWRVDSSGIEPSPGPVLLSAENRPISSGDLTIRVSDANPDSAYYAIITPAFGNADLAKDTVYPSVYATLYGNAVPVYNDESASIVPDENGNDSGVEFVVQVPEDGYYRLVLHSAVTKTTDTPGKRHSVLILNGRPLAIDSTQSASTQIAATAFLPGGINQIRFNLVPGIAVQSLEVLPAHGSITDYAAPSTTSDGDLVFNDVTTSAAGDYALIVTYANDSQGHGGQVEAYADIAVNHTAPTRYYFKNTFDADLVRTAVLPITLSKGRNVIRFERARMEQYPGISRIQIAVAVESISSDANK